MKSLYKNGYFLEPAQEPARGKSIIGGTNKLIGSVSPNSGRPLLQIASIRVDAGPVAIAAWGFADVPLLYGWTCAMCEGPFTYRYLGYGIDILKYVPGEAHSDFPYESYPEAFQAISVDLVPLTQVQQQAIVSMNRYGSFDTEGVAHLEYEYLAVPRHQVGGVPYFLDDHEANSICPCCGDSMSFFASIGDDTLSDPRGYTGNEFVQLIYEICVACKVVTVENFAD